MTACLPLHSLHAARRGARQRGFTLIEVMITVLIIIILASIALPSYTAYTMRGNRNAAQAVMMDMASKQEQYLLVNRRYGDAGAVLGGNYVLPPELATKYEFEIEEDLSPEPTFLITFTPIGGQADDGALTLNSAGTKTPADKW